MFEFALKHVQEDVLVLGNTDSEKEYTRCMTLLTTFYKIDDDEIEKKLTKITWNPETAENGGYKYFMMKEIHEQPKAVVDTIHSVIKDGVISREKVGVTEEDVKNISIPVAQSSTGMNVWS